MEPLNQFANSLAPELSHRRRDSHHYAESGQMEFRTVTLIAKELRQLGYSLALGREVVNKSSRMGLPDELTLQRGFGRAHQQGALVQWITVFEGDFTDIVTTLDTGRPGPVMALYVNMDTLGLGEEQDVSHRPYRDDSASHDVGMIRACGHDGYTTIGLGLAHTLRQFESGLHGVIKLVFQPVEEGTHGAQAMVDVGVADDVDYLTAVHIGTGAPAGTVVYDSDSLMATTKSDTHFTGTAAHIGAKPEDGHNALLAAAQTILILHIIVPHSEGTSGVNVGVVQAGSGRGVVPASALSKVETCGASDVISQYVFGRAQQAIQGAATMYGVDVEIRLMGAATASSSSPQWVAWLQSQAAQVAGASRAIERIEAPTGSEDTILMIAHMQQHRGQASYVVSGTQLVAGHYNERSDFDKQVLAIAVETLARTTLNSSWMRGI